MLAGCLLGACAALCPGCSFALSGHGQFTGQGEERQGHEDLPGSGSSRCRAVGTQKGMARHDTRHDTCKKSGGWKSPNPSRMGELQQLGTRPAKGIRAEECGPQGDVMLDPNPYTKASTEE